MSQPIAAGQPVPLGAPIELIVQCTNREDQPADPTALSLQLRPPRGAIFTLAAIKRVAVVGEWFAEYIPNLPGRWYFKGTGTGALIVAMPWTAFPVENDPSPAE